MSLKLIELQVALPRTHDAGKLSEQMSLRGQHMQEHITSQLQKEDEKKRKQVIKSNQAEGTNIQKDDSSSPSSVKSHGSAQLPSFEAGTKERHPFKGNLIDIVG